MNEKDFEILARGKMATVLLDNIHPYLDKQEKQILQLMKSDFRNGKADHLVLLGHLASLVALEDLKSTMESNARQGEKVHKKQENQDATRNS